MIIKRTDFSAKNLPTTILFLFSGVITYLYIDLKNATSNAINNTEKSYERMLKIVEEKDQKNQVLYERFIEELRKQRDLLDERRELNKNEAELNKKIEKVADKLEKKLNDN